MFSTLTSIPLTLASSTSSFLSNRKKTFAYLGATVGGAYAVGQWGLQRMMEASERGRKQTGAKNDLLNRFNLNLQDAQFTVLALLPTVATQLQTRLDVEDRTAQLGEIAKGERQAKLRESERMRKETAEREEAERLRIQEEEDKVKQEQEAVEKNGEEKAVNGNESSSQEAPVEIVANGEKTEQQAPSAVEESTRHPSKPTLDPAAPAFQPRFAPSTPPQDDFPKLNGHSSDSETAETQSQIANGTSSEPETLVEHEGVETLGKSWAEVVKTDKEEETAVNGEAATEETGTSEAESPSQAVDAAEEISGPAMTSEPEEPVKESTTAEKGSSEVAEPEPAAPPAPTKSKVQLWNEIKILSFTRLLTSIYVLSLLTLQTHVQLALLGRAHYVKSLIDALPPRSPSPTSSSSFTLPSSEKGKEEAEEPTVFNEEEDLEAALYKAKAVPQTREEDRVSEDVERKYLTFSWWLLHEGWKVVQDRVQEKVEEVVGPMGLKTPVVYGELSALLGEIRRRIETQPDGTRFDFAAALHPPTPSGELLTLVTGGGFPAPPPSSSPSSSSLISPPLRSLLNETSDFLLSPDGSLVLTLVLDRLLSLSVSKLEPAFSTPIPPTSASLDGDGGARGARFEDVTEKQTRLASLLPVLTRLTAAGLEGQAGILRGGHGNEFVDAIDDIRELKEFVAIVYASYDRDNLRASY